MYKRIFDIVLSTIALLFLLPIIIFFYFLILIFDNQNPIFTQYRSGLNYKQFKIYKFKSMKIDKNKNKLFVTKLGRFIRLLKIDEVLQLVNVIKNEMSIVGPRPLYPEFNKFYKKRHSVRLNVNPGITGLAQIKLRDSTNWNRKFNFDVIYVKKMSLKLDIYIVINTLVLIFQSLIDRKNRPLESIDYKDHFFKNYKL